MSGIHSQVTLPTGEVVYRPESVKIRFPMSKVVGREDLHHLAFIPWQSQYWDKIPQAYRTSFKKVEEHLQSRTTNVHTALSMSLLGKLLEAEANDIDYDVAYIALMLHDCGWGLVGEEIQAKSFQYGGLHESIGEGKGRALKGSGLLHHTGQEGAGDPEGHEAHGYRLARKLLSQHRASFGLSYTQEELICQIVLHHTQADFVVDGVTPRELVLVHDADKLWSYTHENFWQDTIRKGIYPQVYASHLGAAIDSYFETERAREVARALLLDREVEVADMHWHLENQSTGRVKMVKYALNG